MYTFDCYGVNDAFYHIVEQSVMLFDGQTLKESRDGDVLKFNGPVTIAYRDPRKRVLFNKARNCNPFFHLYETLSFLSGGTNVKELSYYSSKVGRFSDDGKVFHGDYGRRWRYWFEYDQIAEAITHLEKHPTSRRCVIAMWDPFIDSEKAINGGKDVPCNTHIYLAINHDDLTNPVLEITVCNRSNDMVMGLLGANHVQFSMLQELIAGCLGIGIGTYYHFTNNLHVYARDYKPELWREDYSKIMSRYDVGIISVVPSPILTEGLNENPFRNYDIIQDAIKNVVDHFRPGGIELESHTYKYPFLNKIVIPMFTAFRLYKEYKLKDALMLLADKTISDEPYDWLVSGYAWLANIDKQRKEKENVVS